MMFFVYYLGLSGWLYITLTYILVTAFFFMLYSILDNYYDDVINFNFKNLGFGVFVISYDVIFLIILIAINVRLLYNYFGTINIDEKNGKKNTKIQIR